MSNKTAIQIMSGVFLVEMLPDNWSEMSGVELFNLIEETLCEPLENSDPDAVIGLIKDGAALIEKHRPSPVLPDGVDLMTTMSIGKSSEFHNIKYYIDDWCGHTYEDTSTDLQEHLYSVDTIKDSDFEWPLVNDMLELADKLGAAYVRFENC